MAVRGRLALVLVGAIALGMAGWSGALAAPQKAVPQARRATSYGTLTVFITKASGTVWGKVAIKPLKKTCTASKCVYKHVKVGTKMTLTETAVNSKTWPFSNWTLNGSGKGTGTTLKFKMGKTDKASAVYVLPGGTLTVNITDAGELWGKVKIEPLGVSCLSASCTYKNVTLNSTETATETATDTNSWPFSGWTFNGTNEPGRNSTFQFKVGQKDTLTANYCAAPC